MANDEHLAILRQGVEKWNEWRRANPDLKPDLSEVDLNEANLREAELFGANLSGANLGGADLFGANLIGAYLNKATIRFANLIRANIRFANFSDADLSGAKLSETDLSGADLSEANLSEANLSGANLIRANLSRADLSEANLIAARLVKADLSEAQITGVNLYGTARDDWKISGIKCDYVFFDFEGKIRVPKEQDFEPGEFEKLYQQLPTIEYFFEQGFSPLDAVIMDRVVQGINKREPQIELRLDSLHARGHYPHAVFTVLHKEDAESALEQVKAGYETRIKVLEAERDTVEKCFFKAIEQPRLLIEGMKVMTGDQYNIKGQAAAVGPGAQVQEINFKQIWQAAGAELDLGQLARELAELLPALKKEAKEPADYRAIAEVGEAEAAAKAGQGPKALEHLKKAGKWAFGVAEKIGVGVATAYAKSKMGF